MVKSVINFLLVCAATLLCAWYLVCATLDYADLPVVYKSYRTNECVRVETAPSRKPLKCSDIKGRARYETNWVK